MIKAVFFDLDETIVPTVDSREERSAMAAARIVQDYPQYDSVELAARMMGTVPGSKWTLGAAELVKQLGIEETPAGREAAAIWHFEGCEHLLTPIDGVVEADTAIDPEMTLGVITNGYEKIQRYKLDQVSFVSRVSVFVTSERAGCFKPDPGIFQLATAEAGEEPHESIFVGDTYDTDIVGALAAGMHAVWFNPNGHTVEAAEARHHEIRHFADFTAVLDKLNR